MSSQVFVFHLICYIV